MLNMQKKYLCQKNPVVLRLDLRHPVQARKKTMTNNFYDTNALLKRAGNLFEKEENIIISSITLTELEGIKTSAHKDIDIKYSARKLTHLLADNPDKYQVWIFKEKMLEPIVAMGLEVNNDIKILACAIDCDKHAYLDRINFYTNDLSLKNMAKLFFDKDCIKSINPEAEDYYRGYKEIYVDDAGLAELYDGSTVPDYLKVNEYLILRDINDEHIIDKLRWDGQALVPVSFATLDSKYFGKVKPYKDDIQQVLLVDSFLHNKITMVRGRAGSGKTFLSLSYLFHLLEKHKIDKIIVFCNTVATKDSAKLGFYPGTRTEKLLDSQIGNLLSSKLGDRMEVERLINEGKLDLLPFSDIRGYDTSGMNAGIYISEAQNLDINLIKLALQRVGDDSICIIDGDDNTQVDMIDYQGANNGMKRVSKVFRGEEIYGEITLMTTHRSKIAEIAERL